MADHATVPSSSAMDYREHERTYEGFVRFVKISAIVICLILVGMAVTLL